MDVGEAAEVISEFYSSHFGSKQEPCFKAATEGAERFVYCEPSNNNWDRQRERIPAQALIESADFFLEYGNIDILHLTHLGLKMDPPIRHPELYEIGKPVKVWTEPKLIVKSLIYQGSGIVAEQANIFWESLDIGHTWYPSVGGSPLAPRICSSKGCVIPKLRWTNIGFAKRSEVVNPYVRQVAKTLDFFKAVAAGYETDVSGLTGGQAVQLQSIHGHPVEQTPQAHDFKALAESFRTGSCEHASGRPHLAKLVDHFRKCAGLPEHTARSYAARFLRELGAEIRQTQAAKAA
ncbi:MAG TPA: hypothetical protein VMT89_18070 [Candidatus Acidoferrales bacterium]|nr:hypothetical protein [Candidatus Acidoferrales bacterium]